MDCEVDLLHVIMAWDVLRKQQRSNVNSHAPEDPMVLKMLLSNIRYGLIPKSFVLDAVMDGEMSAEPNERLHARLEFWSLNPAVVHGLAAPIDMCQRFARNIPNGCSERRFDTKVGFRYNSLTKNFVSDIAKRNRISFDSISGAVNRDSVLYLAEGVAEERLSVLRRSL